MQQQNNIPVQWFCSITQQLMIDPVIADDGFTYEKKAIQEWFLKSNISPITGAELKSLKLIPNHALRHTIEASNLNKKNQNKKSNIKKQKNEIKQMKDENLKIQISAIQMKIEKEYLLNIQIQPPKQMISHQRHPISLICVLDISESMNTDAVQFGSKDVESHGFSRLDLVKHSINTMVELMQDLDEISLITFSTSAKLLFPFTRTTKAGKHLIHKNLQELFGQGTTNIWDGLKKSLEIAKLLKKQDKNIFIVLLTDGQPNLNPPRGIIATLNKYIEIQNLLIPNIHVFGYGYELDTKLLSSIAQNYNGTYSYIPDCSMVGTVFVNFMAGILSTMTNKLEMQLILPRQMQFATIIGYKINHNKKYNLGCIQYGQNRNFMIKIPIFSFIPNQDVFIQISLRYGLGYKKFINAEIGLDFSKILMKQSTEQLYFRCQYLSMLQKCIQSGNKRQIALNLIKQFYLKLQKIQQINPCQFGQNLLIEIKNNQNQNQGQVEKSYQKQQWYNKWGKHYIPSLYLAHLMQICTNFKDPALQKYGGSKFQQLQNKMDVIFIKSAPPKPSAKKKKEVIYKPAPVNMKQYYNNCGGCIDGQCKVIKWIEDRQETICISKLKRGDKILSSNGQYCEIQAIIVTNVYHRIPMVCIDKLIITPYHPIFQNNNWIFPIDISQPKQIYVESMYNYLLKNNTGISLLVQGIQCISIGHQINNDPVATHSYFGSDSIISDLQQSSNWNKGIIKVLSTVRDEKTQMVIKMIFE